MEKTVSQIMQADVMSVGMDASLAEIRTFFVQHGISAAPVTIDGGAPIGIITMHDLEQAEVREKDLMHTLAWETCTYRPLAVGPDTPLDVAARLMLDEHMHHLLVEDRNGQLKGILSSFDFLRMLLAERDGSPGQGT